MEREEILLKEYEVSHNEITSRGNNVWVSLSIIVSINFLLLSQVAYNFIKNRITSSGYFDCVAGVIFGLMIIFTDFVFFMWQKRQIFIVRILYKRMRRIEAITEMYASTLIHGFDQQHSKNWEETSDSEKKKINELVAGYSDQETKYHPSIGDKLFGPLLKVFMALWFLLIICVVLVHLCPFVRTWLIN